MSTKTCVTGNNFILIKALTEGSVGIQEEGTCSPEINRWSGDLL